MDILLRKATKTDTQFCFELTKQNMQSSFIKNWGGWRDETFLKQFDCKHVTIVSVGDTFVGYYALVPKDSYWCLDNMQLREEYTRKGIGKQLMNTICQKVQNSSIKKIHLTVFKDNPAVKFYKKCGFKTKEDKGTSLLMELKI